MNRQHLHELLDDERLHRFHDGELGEDERAALLALLDEPRPEAAEARDKLAALDELGGLLRGSVTARSDESGELDVWALLRPQLDGARAEESVSAGGSAQGRVIDLASRRRRLGWRVPLWISSVAAAAAVLLVVLLPGPQQLLRQAVLAPPTNGCEIEAVEVTGASVTVMQVDEGEGRAPATVVWLDENTP